jgi:symplekin
MATTLSVSDHIKQLNDARKLVLGDVKLYQSVVRGILPIIAPTSHLELRRWTADFLADTFASPALPAKEKESMQPFVLDTVQSILENPNEDPQILRSMIQTAASLYPIVLRWMSVVASPLTPPR